MFRYRSNIPILRIRNNVFNRSTSSLRKFLKPQKTDKYTNELNKIIYSPLFGDEPVKANTPNIQLIKNVQTIKYYKSLLKRNALVMILKKSPLIRPQDESLFNKDISKLNNELNYQVLNLNENDKKFIDPNHLVRLYDAISLKQLELFKSVLTGSAKPGFNIPLHKDDSYSLITLTSAALYLDSQQLFDTLTKYKSIYELAFIIASETALDTSIFNSQSEPQVVLTYESLLNYAKTHRDTETTSVKTDENYLKLFTKIGQLGFINLYKYLQSVYLFKYN